MRIGIDVRYLSHGLMGGIHTYLMNLIPALVEMGKQHEFFLYADHKKLFDISNLPDNAVVRLLPYQNFTTSIKNDFFTLKKYMAEDNLDVVHFPANYGFGPKKVPKVVTLHDEINIQPLFEIYRGHQKKLRTLLMMTYLHYCAIASLRKCERVITISEYSKQRILKFSSLNPSQVIPIPHAPPSDVRRIEDREKIQEVREKYRLKKDFVLADALKNPGVLVRAWKLIPEEMRKDKLIVFFSRRQDVWPIVNDAVESGIAKFVLKPSREDLNALYSSCLVFVFPSWIEGFGLPILEAMVCGAPIIASNRGAIPEVIGEAGLIIDAEDDVKLSEYLSCLLNNPIERERLRNLGYKRASLYTWPKIAAEVINVYQDIAGNKTR